MTKYRKCIVAAAAAGVIVLNQVFGVDVAGAEVSSIVDAGIALLAALGVYAAPNSA